VRSKRRVFWLLICITIIMIPVACIAIVSWLEAEGKHDLFFNPSHKNAIETRQRGDVIVVALKKYKIERGRFPETLEGLKPLFLENIPSPVYGTGNWSYRTIDAPIMGAEFVLSFHAAGRYPIVFFSSKEDQWSVDN